MDLVRPAFLKQITLRLSAEGDRPIYLAQDRSNGKIFVLTRHLALALRRMSAAALSSRPDTRAAARETFEEADAREAYGFMQMVRGARLQELTGKKPFNPVFASLPLFDVGLIQHWFRRPARVLVSPLLPVLLGLLCLVALILGTRNNWGILDAFQSVFSLEALVTFGLIAPVLKVIHECGHILACTRYGVRVRKAGLYLVGLYPMPFVDCTEADMSARRSQRIAISCAGIVTDVTVGLLAFVAWHLVGGDYAQTLAGNIFVFSTLNSVLFNANPLVKLDGYYALTDAFGKRNLATHAATAMRDLRRWVISFGRTGARPTGKGWWYIAYALASFLYRLKVLMTIAMALLPRYLGLGAAVALWGATVMLLTPLMRDRPVKTTSAAPEDGMRRHLTGRLWLILLPAFLAVALFLIPVPFSVVVPLNLQGGGSQMVSTRSAGVLEGALVTRRFSAGEQIARLRNNQLFDQRLETEQSLTTAQLIYDSVRGEDPARTIAAQEQIDSQTERLNILRREIDGLSLPAPTSGLFVPRTGVMRGSWLPAGTVIGTLYADDTTEDTRAVFSGPFPERHVSHWRDGVVEATLRLAPGTYADLPPDRLELREIVAVDQSSGTRSWSMSAQYDAASPAELAGTFPEVRLRFTSAPIWEHLAFYWTGLVTRYRESQLVDRVSYLE